MFRSVEVRNFRNMPASGKYTIAYKVFRKLVAKKNKDNSILLALYVINPIDKSGQLHEFSVVEGSFEPKMGTLEGNEDNEIGFIVKLTSPLFPEAVTLNVFYIQLNMKLTIQESKKEKSSQN